MAKEKKPSLREMAQEAKQMLLVNPEMRHVHRILSHGLEFVIERTDETRWRLAVARTNVFPSETEMNIVRSAFDVPVGSDEERERIPYTLPKTGRIVTYHRIECRWMDYGLNVPAAQAEPVTA